MKWKNEVKKNITGEVFWTTGVGPNFIKVLKFIKSLLHYRVLYFTLDRLKMA